MSVVIKKIRSNMEVGVEAKTNSCDNIESLKIRRCRAPLPLSVPRACVLDLWEAFNDVAEGFGLTIIEFREMLQCSLKEYLGFTESRLAEVAETVFRAFDDDKVSIASHHCFHDDEGCIICRVLYRHPSHR